MMLQQWIAIFTVLLLAKESCGYCFRGLSQRTPDGETFCSYRGYTLRQWEQKDFPAPACLSCSCFSSGLSCCSYGAANMIHILNNNVSPYMRCRPVADGCEIKWVYRGDESRECTDDERFMMDDLPRPMI